MPHSELHPYDAIRHIIFDVDHTLYKQTPQILEASVIAFCGAAREHLGAEVAHLNNHEIRALGREAATKNQDGFTLGVEPLSQQQRDLHRLFHERWSDQHIRPDPALVERLRRLKDKGIALSAYSDAHQHWTHRVLNRSGFGDVFDPAHILTRDQLDCFSSKRHNDHGHRVLQQRRGFSHSQTLLVEDSEINLQRAKECGMMTVLITHGKTPQIHPPVYDACYDSAMDFIDDFNRAIAHNAGERHINRDCQPHAPAQRQLKTRC